MNQESLCQAVRTLLGHSHNIEPRDQESPAQGVPWGQGQWAHIFQAEWSYALQGGKVVLRVRSLTTGEMRVGWAHPHLHPHTELGADHLAYVFNGHRAQPWHVGSEPFRRTWQVGVVVGCMIDLIESHITFTLNGEVLINDTGSELAFKDFDVGEGEVMRIDGMVDSPPCLRLAHHAPGTLAAPPELLFLHLSLPIQFQPRFRCTPGATPLPQSPPRAPRGHRPRAPLQIRAPPSLSGGPAPRSRG
ncbi:ryanodine receptor 1-like [Pluvialis apricaria]